MQALVSTILIAFQMSRRTEAFEQGMIPRPYEPHAHGVDNPSRRSFALDQGLFSYRTQYFSINAAQRLIKKHGCICIVIWSCTQYDGRCQCWIRHRHHCTNICAVIEKAILFIGKAFTLRLMPDQPPPDSIFRPRYLLDQT